MTWEVDEFGNRSLAIGGWQLHRWGTDAQATVYGSEVGGESELEVTADTVEFSAEIAQGGQYGTSCTERMRVPLAVVAAAIAEAMRERVKCSRCGVELQPSGITRYKWKALSGSQIFCKSHRNGDGYHEASK